MTCTHCGGTVRYALVDGRSMDACVSCGKEHVPAAPVSLARRMTVLDRLNAQAEAEVVKAIKAAIERRGGCVMEICQRKARGSGTTESTPDLFAWVPGMTEATYLALEVKKLGGRIRPGQMALARQGRIRIADSVEAAMRELDGVVEARA